MQLGVEVFRGKERWRELVAFIGWSTVSFSPIFLFPMFIYFAFYLIIFLLLIIIRYVWFHSMYRWWVYSRINGWLRSSVRQPPHPKSVCESRKRLRQLISFPKPAHFLRRMLDANENSVNSVQFLGDPDWLTEIQYNTISADY